MCRAWYVLALDGSNWQRVDLFQFQVDIEGAVVENLAKKCGGFLKSLSLNGCQVSEQICFFYVTDPQFKCSKVLPLLE